MDVNTLLKNIQVRCEHPLCFCLTSNNYDKLSVHYYNPDVLNVIKSMDETKKAVTLGKISVSVKYSDGKWDLRTTDYVPEDYPESVLLLQASNLSENKIIKTNRDKYITKELHDKWNNSKVYPGNIIMGITGVYIGKSVLIPEKFPEANLNQALAKIVLKDEVSHNGELIKINPHFIVQYINSLYGRLQLNRLGGVRAGQSGLSTPEIKSIKIPLISYESQCDIIKTIAELEKEAQYELNIYENDIINLSNLLTSELNLELTQHNDPFILKSDDLLDRLDCNFYNPTIKNLRAEINKLDSNKFKTIYGNQLNIIKSINKAFFNNSSMNFYKYVEIGNIEKDLGEIIDFDENILLNLPTRAKQLVKTHDVLLARPVGSFSSSNCVLIVPSDFDNQCFSTGFIQIRPKDIDESLLLWCILKSEIVQKQIYSLQSGCIQPELNPKSLKHLLLPIPINETRNKIIEKTRKYIKEAMLHKKMYKQKMDEIETIFLKHVENLC